MDRTLEEGEDRDIPNLAADRERRAVEDSEGCREHHGKVAVMRTLVLRVCCGRILRYGKKGMD